MRSALTRREFLAASGLGVAALALPGRSWARTVARERPRGGVKDGVWSFVTEPSLQPPSVTVTTLRNPAPGYLFVASLNGPGQRGPAILDNHGRIVWFKRTDQVAIDFRVQTYKGKPVLTWWEGSISQIGTGQGVGVIVDDTYKEIARVQAGNGYQVDVHEFLLTPQGTALVTIYDEVTRDLTSVGGKASGNVLDSIVQEIDVATGKVLFEWHSLDHVPFSDSYAPVLDPYDYFHVNSVDVDLDGNLVISARNTSAIYKLDRTSGEILWTLGGRSSDFALAPTAHFMYQHDARMHSDGTLTLYDDGPSSSSADSRGLRLGVDFGAMTAVVVQQYHHPAPPLPSAAMGNAQVLPGNAMLVGWGTEPWFTEFGPLGDVRLDATFDGGAWNYRTYRCPWVGRPAHGPIARAVRAGSGTTVYASWNGATEHAYWRVSTGDARTALSVAKTVPAVPFETSIPVPGKPRWVAVTALDAAHKPLSTSAAVAVSG
ncbi:MAG TPA: arylsulfotransferase family protein [Gaiellaceae bacterium]|nr:arylsulfotransferase family protein [Gaiellaceae bacterium]